MPYEVKVSTGDVAAKAGQVRQMVAQIEGELSQLTGAMGELAGTWTGSASGAFQDLYQGWDKTARQTKDALDAIGMSIKGAGESYDQTEQALTSQFAR
jgi:WXG100 family type VII secretion target